MRVVIRGFMLRVRDRSIKQRTRTNDRTSLRSGGRRSGSKIKPWSWEVHRQERHRKGSSCRGTGSPRREGVRLGRLECTRESRREDVDEHTCGESPSKIHQNF